MVKLALMTAAVALAAAPAAAQPLWRNFQSGMTAEQVRAADPRVAANPLAAKERLKDGAACELVIEAVEIDGRPFRSCFYFRAGKLAQISLGDRGATPQMFRGIKTRLANENGPSFAEQQSGRIQEARWTRGDNSRVSLMYIEIGQPIMRIVYEPAAL